MIDWVELGVDVMRNARKRRGLSYETIAREINVSAKTYERYEKAGRIPRPLVAAVAEALDLEIEQPERQRVKIKGAGRPGPDQLDRLEAELVEVRRELDDLRDVKDGVDRIEALLRERLGLPRAEPTPV